jgi:hypothetical protein
MPVLPLIMAAIQLAPTIIQAGVGLENFAKWLIGVVEGGSVTQADWDALHAHEDAARAVLNDTSRDVPKA